MKWFIRAARQGDKTAQHNLGLHFASVESAAAAEAAETAAAEGETTEAESP
jgi:TPR repeat protein